MDKNKNKQVSDVHIEQVNPRKKLNDLEKTAIMQFLIDEHTEEKIEKKEVDEKLSKTQQFKLLNSKKKDTNNNIDLPKTKNKIVQEMELPVLASKKKKTVNIDTDLPKKADGLSQTIRIKLSDLRAAVKVREEQEKAKAMEQNTVPKKSLYDTIIIKLDDIINNRKALQTDNHQKVVSITILSTKKKKQIIKSKDITKNKKISINVESTEFPNQVENLTRYALDKLSSKKNVNVRKSKEYKKIKNLEQTKIPKEDYLALKEELQRIAVDQLYYQYSLKESKRFKMYKVSVALSVLVLIITSAVIFTWFVQGLTINTLSNSLTEVAPVETIEDGTIVNTSLIDEVVNEDGTLDKDIVKNNDMYWKYLNTPLSSVDFTELKKQNKDTIGWLIVNNTNINYPVVQTTNNDYYLKHAFDRSKNYAGWVFADYRDNFSSLSKNTVIYGHGRKDKVMFGSLMNALKPNWYKNPDNQLIQFSTLKYNTLWQVFSVYKVKSESYYITTDFSTDEEYSKFIKEMKKRSIYDFGVNVSDDDKILTLSTCYNDKGLRMVVQARLVKIQTR